MNDFKDGTTGVIILNGPRLCGKDTLADLIVALDTADQFRHLRFKQPLIDLVQAHYGVSQETWNWLYERARKEEPTELLNGKSPREALIHMSEDVIKPVFGRDIFGKAAAGYVEYDKVNVFSDGGFPEEVGVLKEKVGRKHLVVVRIYADGCDYGSDSRSYFEDDGDTQVIDITRTEGNPLQDVIAIMEQFGTLVK